MLLMLEAKFGNNPLICYFQSTGKSHSLGANIQNILSIMKSHNNLCSTTSHHLVSSPTNPTTKTGKSEGIKATHSSEDLNNLLTTVQDEFAQLGL